jgi:glycerate kinase
MKIVIAPNSFKGCLKSTEIVKIIEKEIRKDYPFLKNNKISCC